MKAGDTVKLFQLKQAGTKLAPLPHSPERTLPAYERTYIGEAEFVAVSVYGDISAGDGEIYPVIVVMNNDGTYDHYPVEMVERVAG